MAVSAKQIINSINQRKLPYTADYPPTPADGNCFIHSVLQQLRRPEFRGEFSELLQTVGHEEFRVRVRDFILSSSSQAVQVLKEKFDTLEGVLTENGGRAVGIGMPWEIYWTEIITPDIWPDQTFVQATAWYLGRDIRIISITSERYAVCVGAPPVL